jgi:hypothetical protein
VQQWSEWTARRSAADCGENIAKLPEAHMAKRSSEPIRIEKDHIYHHAHKKLSDVIDYLERSHHDEDLQLVAWLKAGRTILGSPRPDRALLRKLLIPPLIEIAAYNPGVKNEAGHVLRWLKKRLSKN